LATPASLSVDPCRFCLSGVRIYRRTGDICEERFVYMTSCAILADYSWK
jgi:hypothetical protein